MPRVAENRPEWAQRLVDARKRVGISQERLGELTGVSQSAIADYERGRTRPGHEAYLRLSGALNQSSIYLEHGEASVHRTGSLPAPGPKTVEWKDSQRFDDEYEDFIGSMIQEFAPTDDFEKIKSILMMSRKIWTIALLLPPEIPLSQRVDLAMKQILYLYRETPEAVLGTLSRKKLR